MIWHLLAHAVKHVDGSAMGKQLKWARCEKCATEYWYFLSRIGRGRASYIVLGDSEAARERANEHAKRNLASRLNGETEPVPCPNCHWVNEILVMLVRRRRYRKLLVIAIVLLLIGGIAIPAVSAMADDSYPRGSPAPMSLALRIGGGLILAGLSMFPLRVFLRRRIDPNSQFPRPSPVAPGTPPAMLPVVDARSGAVRLQVTDTQYEIAGNLAGWAILRPDELVFPNLCCLCLNETADTYRPILKISNQSAVFPVPFCKECRRIFRRVWLMSAGICTLIVLVLAAMIFAIPGMDDFGHLIVAGFVALFGFIFAIFVVPDKICRPYRSNYIDRDRGIVKFASKNEEYAQLLSDRGMQNDALLAARTAPRKA